MLTIVGGKHRLREERTRDCRRTATRFASLPPALLALEDGTVYRGVGFGADGRVGAGEVVFNTAITGYQEVLTDPSYRGQIVTMTAPEIGNVGINPIDFESARPWCAGFVVRELSPVVSNWRARAALDALLAEHGVAGIAGIDTRALTRRLRLSGAQRAVITRDVADPAAARRARAQAPRRSTGATWSREVTSREALRLGRALVWPAPASRRAADAARAPPRRRLRLRHQAQHPAPPARVGLPRHRGAGARPAPRTCWR